jgi:hypothetical protein
MGIFIDVDVVCDGCSYGVVTSDREAADLDVVQEEYEKKGWTFDDEDKAFCPNCAKEKS